MRELRALYAALLREEAAGCPVDVVMGNKLTRSDPAYGCLISWAYHHLMTVLFQFKVHDVDCDFRLIKRHVLDSVVLTQNSGAIALELMSKVQLAGFRTVEIPVHHYHRAYGISQFFHVRRLARVLVSLVRLWWWLRIQGAPGTPDPLPAPLPFAAAHRGDPLIAARTLAPPP